MRLGWEKGKQQMAVGRYKASAQACCLSGWSNSKPARRSRWVDAWVDAQVGTVRRSSWGGERGGGLCSGFRMRPVFVQPFPVSLLLSPSPPSPPSLFLPPLGGTRTRKGGLKAWRLASAIPLAVMAPAGRSPTHEKSRLDA